ncbi:unannotated protein [freshwater metagenome]|uniref:Unannotated protein n=1 Tax=freshwater metagenome TaxID=449393 RepID=A0A6J6FC24_9ZZZZ
MASPAVSVGGVFATMPTAARTRSSRSVCSGHTSASSQSLSADLVTSSGVRSIPSRCTMLGRRGGLAPQPAMSATSDTVDGPSAGCDVTERPGEFHVYVYRSGKSVKPADAPTSTRAIGPRIRSRAMRSGVHLRGSLVCVDRVFANFAMTGHKATKSPRAVSNGRSGTPATRAQVRTRTG